MALIDPCVALPFDPKDPRHHDNRETNNEDQPLTPTDPANVQSNSQSTDAAQSNNGAPTSPSNQSQYPPSNLPHVLQSVFSYIFHQDHSQSNTNNNAQTPTSAQQAQHHLSHNKQSNSNPSQVRSFVPSTPPLTPLTNQELLDGVPLTPMSLNQTINQSITEYSPSTSPAKLYHRVSQASAQNIGQRPCAILDLDETLLHSFFPDKVTPYQYQYMVMIAKQQAAQHEQLLAKQAANPDVPIDIPRRTMFEVDVGDGTIVVLHLRPYLKEFLDALFDEYEVGVWSAGGKLYVDAICRVLFPVDGPHHPICQLCWDDVQVETQGMSSYTKPLTTLTQRFPQLQLNKLFLVDNRRENGYHFPHQFVQAPDYLPRPWEWQGAGDRDDYLLEQAMADIRSCVRSMEQRAKAYADEELAGELEDDEDYQPYGEPHSIIENELENDYECDIDHELDMQDDEDQSAADSHYQSESFVNRAQAFRDSARDSKNVLGSLSRIH